MYMSLLVFYLVIYSQNNLLLMSKNILKVNGRNIEQKLMSYECSVTSQILETVLLYTSLLATKHDLSDVTKIPFVLNSTQTTNKIPLIHFIGFN